MPDGEPEPAAVEPHAAFYGLWPKFADPAGDRAARTPLHRERPTPHVCGWWTAGGSQGLRTA